MELEDRLQRFRVPRTVSGTRFTTEAREVLLSACDVIVEGHVKTNEDDDSGGIDALQNSLRPVHENVRVGRAP